MREKSRVIAFGLAPLLIMLLGLLGPFRILDLRGYLSLLSLGVPFELLELVGQNLELALHHNSDAGSDSNLRLKRCSNSLNFYSYEKTVVKPRVPRGACSLLTSAPWFVDENHSFPGVGVVNVLFVTWARSYHIKHSRYVKEFGYDDTSRPLSLRGKNLRLKYRSKSINDGSSLHFWFQGKIGLGRVYNFIHKTPLALVDGVHEVILPVGDASYFACMGSTFRSKKYLVYGCDIPPELGMRHVNYDLGLLRLVGSGKYEGSSAASVELMIFELL
jgi:hypothetical protein